MPVMMRAAPYADFPERLADKVAEILLMIGVEEPKAHQEWLGMKEFSLGKTDNRSVLGTMKQFIIDLTYASPLRPIDLNEPVSLSLRLVDSGSLILSEFSPRREVLKLFGSEKHGRPKKLILVPREREE